MPDYMHVYEGMLYMVIPKTLEKVFNLIMGAL